MKQRILLLALVLTLSSFGLAHKFYVSVTNVEYSEKNASLQVISRIFIDDLEATLLERYDLKAGLGTPEESPLAKAYIERYFRAKFALEVNGDPVEYTFLGTRTDKDLLVCYLEVPNLEAGTLTSIGVRNDLLTDMFEEQKNLVHLKALGKKHSLVLVRENNKGMLNL
ncbi:hypothetical protein OZ410_00545 [Robiginitalea sp. M366]|uniref:DUF6702 family protein n=1 Tax=Robiginitalea aestuariiviva TaxID=3036903 RepID=UPI00240D8155|nr:DUF6702 family protein [Robiginitalea aestuariiviva]MDG1570785.1 hypothetical protein [Robiginitalea aestuariiviva]